LTSAVRCVDAGQTKDDSFLFAVCMLYGSAGDIVPAIGGAGRDDDETPPGKDSGMTLLDVIFIKFILYDSGEFQSSGDVTRHRRW
jgi:hypothetical protein